MEVNHVQRNGIHWDPLISLKVNIISWVSKNQQPQRNSMNSSDSHTNSKCESLYGCRMHSHCDEVLTTTVKLLTHTQWLIFIINRRTDDPDVEEAIVHRV